MQSLRDLLQPERLTAIVDVGANPIDTKPCYQRMLDEGLCTVTGFEPNPEALERLIANKGPNETYLPYAIGCGQKATLYVGDYAGMTSLLEPDQTQLKLFGGAAGWGKVVHAKPMSTTRLDDFADIPAIDLLQMDVQGAEIDVLRSGRYKLAGAVAILTEVSFVPIYKDQPSFGEVDIELRCMGFVPHCFVGAKVMPIATEIAIPHPDPHQIVDADVMYVRNYARPMHVEQWKQLALIAHHICGSFDLAMYCIARMVDVGGVAATAPSQYQRLLESQ